MTVFFRQPCMKAAKTMYGFMRDFPGAAWFAMHIRLPGAFSSVRAMLAKVRATNFKGMQNGILCASSGLAFGSETHLLIVQQPKGISDNKIAEEPGLVVGEDRLHTWVLMRFMCSR